MSNFRIRNALKLGFTLTFLFCSAATHATIIGSIDQFTVNKTGAAVPPLSDGFDNGLTPSQESGTYSVHGTFPDGAESNNKLTLNSDWGTISQNAAGGVRQNLHTTFKSNIDPTRPNAGLNIDSIFDVTGTFDLVTPNPGELNNGYGVRFIDAAQNQATSDHILELNVQNWVRSNGEQMGLVIRFMQQNFITHNITTLGYLAFDPLAQDADQIQLRISHSVSGSSDFSAAFAFGTSGNFDPFMDINGTGTLFNGTRFVRSQFQVFTELPNAVPEPATLALLGVGLLGLVASRRRGSHGSTN